MSADESGRNAEAERDRGLEKVRLFEDANRNNASNAQELVNYSLLKSDFETLKSRVDALSNSVSEKRNREKRDSFQNYASLLNCDLINRHLKPHHFYRKTTISKAKRQTLLVQNPLSWLGIAWEVDQTTIMIAGGYYL